MEILQEVKNFSLLNSIPRARLNFRRRLILCTTLYRNPIQASNFDGTFNNFSLEKFYAVSQKMPLYFFYTIVQKAKTDQKPKSREEAPPLIWVFGQFWLFAQWPRSP